MHTLIPLLDDPYRIHMQDSSPGNREGNRNADQDMSARKGRQNVKAGFQQMEGIVDSLIERHLSKFEEYSSHNCIVDAVAEKPKNKIGAAIGFCVHLLVLVFTLVIVWTAKPSSSELS